MNQRRIQLRLCDEGHWYVERYTDAPCPDCALKQRDDQVIREVQKIADRLMPDEGSKE